MSAGIKYVTDASFEQDVLKSDKPVCSTSGLSGVVLAK